MNKDTEETIALRKENEELKEVIQKIQKHYKLREIEHKRVLLQCSVGLRQAAVQLERQNQIITDLKQEKEAKNTQEDMPDSTT